MTGDVIRSKDAAPWHALLECAIFSNFLFRLQRNKRGRKRAKERKNWRSAECGGWSRVCVFGVGERQIGVKGEEAGRALVAWKQGRAKHTLAERDSAFRKWRCSQLHSLTWRRHQTSVSHNHVTWRVNRELWPGGREPPPDGDTPTCISSCWLAAPCCWSAWVRVYARVRVRGAGNQLDIMNNELDRLAHPSDTRARWESVCAYCEYYILFAITYRPILLMSTMTIAITPSWECQFFCTPIFFT